MSQQRIHDHGNRGDEKKVKASPTALENAMT